MRCASSLPPARGAEFELAGAPVAVDERRRMSLFPIVLDPILHASNISVTGWSTGKGRGCDMPDGRDATKGERFAEFLRRLRFAPPASNDEEAYAQICDILNAVEDEMTSIPYDPDNWRN